MGVRAAGVGSGSRVIPAMIVVAAGLVVSVAPVAIGQDFPAQSEGATTAPVPQAPPEEAARTESTPVEDQAEIDDKFSLAFTPYMWLTSLSGDLGFNGVELDVDASFVDILDNSNTVFGLMGALEGQWDRIIVQFNGAWTYVEADGKRALAEDITAKADMTTQAAWIELLGGYRILDRGVAEINDKRRFTLDAFGGARLTVIDAETDVTAKGTVTLPDGTVLQGSRSTSIDEEEIWGEPFIGLRVGVDFTQRFGMSLRGDIGGFGVAGSEFSWQILGGLGYKFHTGSWNGTALLGFRSLAQDYEDDGFKWDMTTYGPILGVQFTS